MKRTTTSPKNINVLLQVATRMALAKHLGTQYSGKRDLFEALGYPKDLTPENYYAQYARQDMAAAIIDKPIKAMWRGDVLIAEVTEEPTALEEEWKVMWTTLKLKSKFVRLDKLTSLNEYGVLVLGFSGVSDVRQMAEEVTSATELLYVKPYGSRSVTIKKFEEDVTNPRYGLPLLYEIEVDKASGEGTEKLLIHQSRIIHVTIDLLESEWRGFPVLEKVFNRLMDLEKIVGGSAEMYWRGARPGYQGKVDQDYTVGKTMMEDLQTQIDEYENDLRRILVNEGVSLEALQTQVTDPSKHVDIQVQMISAVTGIPKRILTGTERGELASSQDKDAWLALIQDRREEFAEPSIIRAFIDRLIEVGVLSDGQIGEEGEVYGIVWNDLFAVSEADKVKLGKERATALKEYTSNAMADSVIPQDVFVRYFLGFNEEEANKIIETQSDLTFAEQGQIDIDNDNEGEQE